MDAKLPENVSAELPVPRNDRHIYAFQQLPPAIRQQLPVLRMALHAYNRADHRASLIQINNQIYREGDVIDRTLAVEQITEDGAVLRYDGYRFLLPRRGN
ncbi:MAG: general secretion pathway protein GspB [Desulfuromonadales bacterium]|nr:general secretion pathway protein GspB [Desulfuromonadales bacterium]MBN2793553.1 general secretion pathway protein GspB [Desulfuromonadales bacterium]